MELPLEEYGPFLDIWEAVEALAATVQVEAAGLEVHADARGARGHLHAEGEEAVPLAAVAHQEGAHGLGAQPLVRPVHAQGSPVEAAGVEERAGAGDAPVLGVRSERAEVRVARGRGRDRDRGTGPRARRGRGRGGGGGGRLWPPSGLCCRGDCIVGCHLVVCYHPTRGACRRGGP